jgi:hypothetical protein
LTTTAPLPSGPTEGYQKSVKIWFSPHVLQWVAPVSVILIFFLQLLPSWVGLYPGGFPAATQNAWAAAFNVLTPDKDITLPWSKDEAKEPGFNVLLIFYLLLFLPNLVVTIGALVVTRVPLKLPPAVQQLLPWRWGIVAAANLIVFFFLALQLLPYLGGFSLETKVAKEAHAQFPADKAKNTMEEKTAEVGRGTMIDSVQRTNWLRLAVLLHLLAILSAAMMFWLGQRGEHRPLPRLELLW